MNNYKEIAINALGNAGVSFSYAGENGCVRSDIKGIKRLMALVDEGFSLAEGFTADKVVGKAAAFVMVYLGAKNVYAETLSEHAKKVFDKYGVNAEYKNLVPVIINRKGDGICPMEETVLDIESPEKAIEALKIKLESLAKNA